MPGTSSTAAGDPWLGVYRTRSRGCTACHSIGGVCVRSIAHAWASPKAIHHPRAPTGSTPGCTRSVAHTETLSQSEMPMWHRLDVCAHTTTADMPSHAQGHGQGADTGTHVHTQHARPLQRRHRAPTQQLWHAGSSAQRPHGAHLHKQHFFLLLTRRHTPCIFSKLLPVAACAWRGDGLWGEHLSVPAPSVPQFPQGMGCAGGKGLVPWVRDAALKPGGT